MDRDLGDTDGLVRSLVGYQTSGFLIGPIDCKMQIVDLVKFSRVFSQQFGWCLIGYRASGFLMGSVDCEIQIVDLVKFSRNFVPVVWVAI